MDDAIHAVKVRELKIPPDGWAKTYLSRLDRLGLCTQSADAEPAALVVKLHDSGNTLDK